MKYKYFLFVINVLYFFCADAMAGSIRINYAVSLAGISIGKAVLNVKAEENSYKAEVHAALTGLVGAITSGHGAATALGIIRDKKPFTNGFSAVVSNGKEERTIQIAASGGVVRDVVIKPNAIDKEHDEERIPLTEADKSGVVDPLGAFVFPTITQNIMEKGNCDRKIQVFDGMQRFDIVTSYQGSRQIYYGKGISSPVLMCSVSYIPVAGHRPRRKITKFMAENKDMSVWLIFMPEIKMFLPYRIAVKTMIGMNVIEAENIVVE